LDQRAPGERVPPASFPLLRSYTHFLEGYVQWRDPFLRRVRLRRKTGRDSARPVLRWRRRAPCASSFQPASIIFVTARSFATTTATSPGSKRESGRGMTTSPEALLRMATTVTPNRVGSLSSP